MYIYNIAESYAPVGASIFLLAPSTLRRQEYAYERDLRTNKRSLTMYWKLV